MGPDHPRQIRRPVQRYPRTNGLWLGTYAGSNPSEYFAELTMWYWNSHGSFNGFQGPRPDVGTEGLKKYDPDAFVLFDEFYSGKMDIPPITPRGGRREPRVTKEGSNRSPAGRVVARLYSYKVGETKLSDVYTDAGITNLGDAGQTAGSSPRATPSPRLPPRHRQCPAAPDAAAASGTVNVTVSYHQATYRAANIADLDFKDGVLSAFKWDN